MIGSSTERKAFSTRLQQCLRNAHHSPDSGTELAREFNTRYLGKPIGVQTARKWLIGESMPTQDKIRILAHWLQVSVGWLYSGEGDQQVKKDVRLDALDSTDVRLLDEHDRDLMRKFVGIMMRSHRQ
jgi:transcriptional regulator with XRE-family HTH domain